MPTLLRSWLHKKNKPTSIYHSETDDEVCSLSFFLSAVLRAESISYLFFTDIPPIEVNPFLDRDWQQQVWNDDFPP